LIEKKWQHVQQLHFVRSPRYDWWSFIFNNFYTFTNLFKFIIF